MDNNYLRRSALSPIHGTYWKGRIDLDSPVDWPEGARVTVIPAAGGMGLSESDWPDSPETRATLVARIDAIEPLELTAADEAEIASAREAVRKASIRKLNNSWD